MAATTPASNSPRRRKQPSVAQLGPENWGERLHRAYKTAKAAGYVENYREVAARISRVLPCGDSQIIRLEDNEGLPHTSRVRLLAYLTVLAYGYDPADFDLNELNVPLAGLDLKRVADLLKPSSRCTPLSAA